MEPVLSLCCVIATGSTKSALHSRHHADYGGRFLSESEGRKASVIATPPLCKGFSVRPFQGTGPTVPLNSQHKHGDEQAPVDLPGQGPW